VNGFEAKTGLPFSQTLAKSHQAVADQGVIMARRQACKLQHLVFEVTKQVAEAPLQDPKDPSEARAKLAAVALGARAWKELRAQVRIEQGKPSPGSIRRPVQSPPAKSRPGVIRARTQILKKLCPEPVNPLPSTQVQPQEQATEQPQAGPGAPGGTPGGG
jgi:hypothetical protein